MSSIRQIEANRRNALKSTGPKTEAGKEQSRRSALRHGLTAETVIASLEDLEDYKAFEATIIADYDAQTAVERELVLRLASLLWRSRRAILIETGLFAIQAEILRARRAARPRAPSQPRPERRLYRLLNGATAAASPNGYDQSKIEDNYDGGVDPPSADSGRMLTHCFLHLANLESGAFERLNRYEVALW